MPLAYRLIPIAISFFFLSILPGCRIGEDDPLFSLRTRDDRLKNTWRLRQMQSETKVNLFTQGGNPVESTITSTFDGRDLQIKSIISNTQVIDTTFGFAYIMEVKSRGKLSYTTTLVQQGLGIKSGGEDAWFWLSDDKPKSRVYLGSAFQFTQIVSSALPIPPVFSEFEVKELRDDLLRLSLRKRIQQTGLDGTFQEVTLSSDFEFRPN